MLRRCLVTPKPMFGIIPPPRSAPASTSLGNGYGTMLEIRNVVILPDGRSTVDTWGAWRFRIKERRILDGYIMAQVERIEDVLEEVESYQLEVEGKREAAETFIPPLRSSTEASNLSSPSPTSSLSQQSTTKRARTNEDLMTICRDFVQEMKDGAPWFEEHLVNNMQMPDDAATFGFWMATVCISHLCPPYPGSCIIQFLPIPEHEKAKLLPICSPHLRLRLVVHWIEQLRSNW